MPSLAALLSLMMSRGGRAVVERAGVADRDGSVQRNASFNVFSASEVTSATAVKTRGRVRIAQKYSAPGDSASHIGPSVSHPPLPASP